MALAQRYEHEQRLRQTPAVIGSSEQALQIRGFAEMAARNEYTVLLRGETGTGKDHLAEVIHFMGHSNPETFVPVDCGGLSENLLETELFGHTRGAFTDAPQHGKQGLVQVAEGGTLFFNEVANMPLSLQVKLLRVLEKKTFRQVGGTKEMPINTRIIAATNANLELAVQQGGFRPDLYYRLNTITFTVAPLRERSGDIPELTEYFLQREEILKNFSPEIMAILMRYKWPGNVRELKNILVRAVFNSDSNGDILPEHVDLNLADTGDREMPTFREVQENYFREVLRKARGRAAKAAAIAGVNRKTIYNKIEEFRLQDFVNSLRKKSP